MSFQRGDPARVVSLGGAHLYEREFKWEGAVGEVDAANNGLVSLIIPGRPPHFRLTLPACDVQHWTIVDQLAALVASRR